MSVPQPIFCPSCVRMVAQSEDGRVVSKVRTAHNGHRTLRSIGNEMDIECEHCGRRFVARALAMAMSALRRPIETESA